jgi:hypothetical protein
MGEFAFFAWRRVLNDFLWFGDGILVWNMVNGRKRGFDSRIDQGVWDRCGFHPECTGYTSKGLWHIEISLNVVV